MTAGVFALSPGAKDMPQKPPLVWYTLDKREELSLAVFSIDQTEAEAYESFFPKEKYADLGNEGYHTLSVLSDEGFVMGVLQFHVDFRKNTGTRAVIRYLYVQEEFRESGATALLLTEYRNILEESGIRVGSEDLPDDTCCFLYSDTVSKLCDHFPQEDVSTRDCYSISFIGDAEFRKMKRETGLQKIAGKKSEYEEEISSFFNGKDGCGFLLVKKQMDQGLELSLAGFSGADLIPKIKELFTYSLHRAVKQYGPEQIFTISLTEETVPDKTADQILPSVLVHLQES